MKEYNNMQITNVDLSDSCITKRNLKCEKLHYNITLPFQEQSTVALSGLFMYYTLIVLETP